MAYKIRGLENVMGSYNAMYGQDRVYESQDEAKSIVKRIKSELKSRLPRGRSLSDAGISISVGKETKSEEASRLASQPEATSTRGTGSTSTSNT